MTGHSTTDVLIVAAGRGVRAPGAVPKQFRSLGGRPVLGRSAAAFLDHHGVGRVIPVIGVAHRGLASAALGVHPRLGEAVTGGASRAESVLNGLRALAESPPDHVLIHDAARPLISSAVISRVIDALDDAKGAVPSLAAADAMRSQESDGTLGAPVPREGVVRAQTPQGFHFAPLLRIMEDAAKDGTLASLPDEAEAMIAAGHRVVAVAGDPMNFKLTVPEDFAMAERLIAAPMRVGQGFDVHAFGPGDQVILCGVPIPHENGLTGHSDADVGLHALTDALLGAAGAGDIGRHFPPSDPQWKGADSAQFLRHAVLLAAEAGYGIGNLDVTLICETPKIGPHAEAMRARIADICGIGIESVGVKATTTERLGFCGRGEGIAAQAVATIVRA